MFLFSATLHTLNIKELLYCISSVNIYLVQENEISSNSTYYSNMFKAMKFCVIISKHHFSITCTLMLTQATFITCNFSLLNWTFTGCFKCSRGQSPNKNHFKFKNNTHWRKLNDKTIKRWSIHFEVHICLSCARSIVSDSKLWMLNTF